MAERKSCSIDVDEHGRYSHRIDAVKAPITTKNFVDYVSAGHYDGLIFHRVIPGFMIQGGGMEPG